MNAVSGFFSTSQLEISHKLNEATPSGENPTPAAELYSVTIDNLQVSASAQPFSASSTVVELFACNHCFQPGDGSGFFEVRRIGEYVLWSNIKESYDPHKTRALKAYRTHLFYGPDYNDALGSGNYLDLPNLKVEEINTLVTSSCPDPKLALYMVPEQSADEFGMRTLERIWCSFMEDSGSLQLASDDPESYVDLRIGLDLEGFPECRWLVGSTAQGLVAMPLTHPLIPVWLIGDSVQSAFEGLQLHSWRS